MKPRSRILCKDLSLLCFMFSSTVSIHTYGPNRESPKVSTDVVSSRKPAEATSFFMQSGLDPSTLSCSIPTVILIECSKP